MVLKTFSQSMMLSPLEIREAIHPNSLIELSDCSSARGVLHLRGPGVEKMLTSDLRDEPLAPGEAILVEIGILACLAEEEFILVLPDINDIPGTLEEITNPSAINSTITDLSHGRGQIRIGGARAKDLMNKLCGLDFSEASFPNLHTAQTSFAKIHTTIVRLDEHQDTPVYYLIVDRSLAAYLWKVLLDADHEFNDK